MTSVVLRAGGLSVLGRILDTPDAPSRMSRVGGVEVATVDLGTTLNPSLKLRERARSSWKAVQ
jgi:hypothetical protein